MLRVNVYDESCLRFANVKTENEDSDQKKKQRQIGRLYKPRIASDGVMEEWSNIDGKSTWRERMPVGDCGKEVQPIVPASPHPDN